MNAIDLRKKTTVELKNELLALLKELFNLRVQKSLGQSPQAHLFKKVKRQIARVKTIMHEKKGL